MTILRDIPSIGDALKAAWLFKPHESAADAMRMAEQAIAYKALHMGCLLGDITVEITTPDDRQVNVPDDAGWPNGTRVALASARITDVIMSAEEKRAIEFLSALEPHEREALHRHTRAIAAQYGNSLTDEQCDHLVMAFGPRIEESELQKMIADNVAH